MVHRHCDTLRIGIGHKASHFFDCNICIILLGLHHATISLCHQCHTLPLPKVPMRPGLTQQTDAHGHICIVLLLSQRVLLFEQGGNIASQGNITKGSCTQYHPGNTGMARQFRHLPAERRNQPHRINGTKRKQQLTGSDDATNGRRGEPRQSRNIRLTKSSNIQQHWCQIGIRYLRLPLFRHAMLRSLRPQAIAHTRSQTSGTPHALCGHIHADGNCFKMAEAGTLVEDKRLTQSAVDDHPHPFYRERGLGNRRGQHNLPFSFRHRHDGTTLVGRRKIAIKGENRRGDTLQHFGTTQNLPLSGKEDKDVALMFLQGTTHGTCCHLGYVEKVGIFLCIDHLNGKHTSLALDEWCLQSLADGRGINRGRHHDKTQIRTQNLLHPSRQGKGKVGMQAPFVKLIEDNRTDIIERRVTFEHTGQDAFRQDLNPCPGTHARLKTDAVANRLANGFAHQFGHSLGNLSGRQSPGLQHQYLASCRNIGQNGKGQQR